MKRSEPSWQGGELREVTRALILPGDGQEPQQENGKRLEIPRHRNALQCSAVFRPFLWRGFE